MSEANTNKNEGRDTGWYKASNILTDKWGRIVGPQSFFIYHVMKSLCIGDETRSRPQASQQDWAEWCGVEIRVFRRALKTLVDFGLVEVFSPANPSHATMYDVRDPEEVPLPNGTLLQAQKVLPLPKDNRFHDPLFELEAWKHNMFRQSETPRIRRRIQEALNVRSTKSATTRSTKSATTIVRQSIDRQLLSSEKKREKLNGSDEPSQILNTLFSGDSSIPQEQEGGWISISIKTDQELGGLEIPHRTMADRVRKILPSSKGALRKLKSESLPPRDQMPQCLQVWFSLPLVTKPSVKTYPRILRLLRQLEQGKFPTEYKNLKSDWTHRKGQPEIVRKYLDRSWSDAELAQLLDIAFRQILSDAAYWPQNKEKYFKGKVSFESFVFHPHFATSWLLDLAYRKPQLLRTIDTQQALQQDKHPDATYEIAESLEISRKMNLTEYADVARNLSMIVRFLQSLPQDQEELGGIFRINRHASRIASSLAGFLRERYSWVKEANAGLIKLSGMPVRQWLEEWNDQEIRWPGHKRAYRLLDLLDEFNRHGRIQAADQVSREISAPTQPEGLKEELDVIDLQQEAMNRTERDLERQRQIDNVSPDDLIPIEEGKQERKQEKGSMWPRIKTALARLKQGVPDPVVDESYAGF